MDLHNKQSIVHEEQKLELAPKKLGFLRLRLLISSPVPFIALMLLILFVSLALFLAPSLFEIANRQNLQMRFYEPFQTDAGFWYILGGDSLGRPLLAELIYGARASFAVSISSVLAGAVIGTFLGLYSGYKGGRIDAILMRLADIIVTLPSLLMALAILYVLGSSTKNLVIVLTIARLPVFLRTARAQTLSIKEQTFVEVSKSIGTKQWRIIWQDIRPLVTPTIMTLAMLELGHVMLAVSGLSFLGVGLQRPHIDWGTMVAEGRQYMSRAPWITVAPGIAIMITVLAAIVLSNWMRAVADPLQSNKLYANMGRKRRKDK